MADNDPRNDTALRRLVDRVPDVIFRFRLLPAPGIEYISEAATRLTGYTPDEFYADPELGLSVAHPDDRGRLAEMVRTGDEKAATIRYVRKDGSTIWAEVKLSPFYADDRRREIAGVDGVVREAPEPSAGTANGIRIVGGVRIDIVERAVSVDGRPVRLTPAEFKLLLLLTEQPGRTVTRDEMMRYLWRSAHTGDGHTCEAHLSNLRKKVEADPRNPARILTVRGQGYRFAI